MEVISLVSIVVAASDSLHDPPAPRFLAQGTV